MVFHNSFQFSKGALYQKILENLLGNLQTDRIHRVDVNFNINKK